MSLRHRRSSLTWRLMVRALCPAFLWDWIMSASNAANPSSSGSSSALRAILPVSVVILKRSLHRPPERSKFAWLPGIFKSSVIFLRKALASGERMATDVIAEGEAAGFSKKEIRTAREHLGISPRKEGFGKEGKYYWSLPDVQ